MAGKGGKSSSPDAGALSRRPGWFVLFVVFTRRSGITDRLFIHHALPRVNQLSVHSTVFQSLHIGRDQIESIVLFPGDRRKSSSPSSSSTYPSKMVTGVGAAAVVAVLSYIVYGVHDRYVVRPAIIATKSHLPTVIDADAYTLDREQLWGTYRSNLYFGMRTRSPNSPVVGLMCMFCGNL